ncbi:TrbI/VirB10 family protein [Thalassotalea marina]|uniref:Conjugal transfer protein TraB n=1 Tax=Thalassotalea marina TaxID=1673741 RepID=A0A919BQ58_9GAMM|nr:TrbI/VirB10 family protein [Thalassotalea marina]GHG07076.1 conjugal transfer protein TraB [Thalassotalea marina]
MSTDAKNEDVLNSKPSLTAVQKKKIFTIAAIIVVLVFFYIMFQATGHQGPKEAIKEEPIKIGENNLSDDEFEKFNKQVESLQEIVSTQQAELNEFRKKQERDNMQKDGALNQLQKLMEIDKQAAENTPKPPLSNEPSPALPEQRYPQAQEAVYVPKNTPPPSMSHQLAEPTALGGVGFIEFAPTQKKKAQESIEEYYLPPSFFSAKLLTGIDAQTSKEGAEEPKQIMFMVDAPAVLPNHIREDLSGCFVMANANGDLGTERIEVIVVNLSCVSADGTAVIDQPVLGYVNDLDGKRDMAGNVVSKEGSKLAWLFAATVVSAAGVETSVAGVDQNQTALGTVSTFDPSKSLQRSLGGALKDTSDEYKTIILDYIRQSAPVVEVGPLKDVTVVIQEGVWLKIKSRQKQGGVEI